MADKPLVWAPKAYRDLDRIWRYYCRIATADVAEALLREIVARANLLESRSMMGRSRAELLPDLRSVLVRPYTVFYRCRQDTIEIVRILHERRDLPTVLKKVRD